MNDKTKPFKVRILNNTTHASEMFNLAQYISPPINKSEYPKTPTENLAENN